MITDKVIMYKGPPVALIKGPHASENVIKGLHGSDKAIRDPMRYNE